MRSNPKVQIIILLTRIRQKQQTPHFLIQPGEVRLHSWMLYTSQAPVLELAGEHIKTKEDIEAAFHALNLCSQEEEEQKPDGRKKGRASQSK